MYGSPKVSAIIPTYNCASYLAAAIESALAQTYQNLEIVVVDDGSTDNTRDVVQRFFTKIKYVRQSNRGLSAARNVGIHHAKGELIAFLDADDMWLSEKINLQVRAFQQYPEAGLSFTNNDVFDDGGGSGQPAASANVLAWLKGHQIGDTETAYGSMYQVFLGGNCMHVSSVIVMRDAVERVGLFDEKVKLCEDFDLWLRIAQKYPVVGINRVLSRYRYRYDSLSGASDVRTYRWQEAMARELGKHLRIAAVPHEFHGVIKSTLNRLCWMVGWWYFSKNQFKKARSLFFCSLRCRPFTLQPWMYWAACFLPLPVVEALRQVKRRF